MFAFSRECFGFILFYFFFLSIFELDYLNLKLDSEFMKRKHAFYLMNSSTKKINIKKFFLTHK